MRLSSDCDRCGAARPGPPERLLMLAPVMPSDRGNGLAMRAGFFLDGYARRFTVDLAVAPVAGNGDSTAFVASRVNRLIILDVGRPDTHYALLAALRNPSDRLAAFRHYGRPSLAAFAGAARHALDSLAAGNRYHAVHVSRLYIAELASPWIGQGRDRPRLVLDCDDDDAMACRRMAAMHRRAGDAVAAAFALAEAQAFDRFAAAWLPKFDLVLAASEKEARTMSRMSVRVVAVRNVVAPVAAIRQAARRKVRSVLFVGTLSYAPNADAVLWFVARVWRRLVRALRHGARLVIVGANPPPAIARLGSRPDIVVTGAVPEVSPYYRDADLAIAPVRAGGGTRIKIIEAAAHGVPMVATSFAAEGTTFRHGVDILIADDETAFLRFCLLLDRNRPLSALLAKRARIKANRDYSYTRWQARVTELILQPRAPVG